MENCGTPNEILTQAIVGMKLKITVLSKKNQKQEHTHWGTGCVAQWQSSLPSMLEGLGSIPRFRRKNKGEGGENTHTKQNDLHEVLELIN